MPGSSRLAFKSRLMLSLGLLVLLLAALTLWKVCAGIEADREVASTQTRSFAYAMSAHVGSQLRVIDLSLARSAAALSDLDMSTVRSPETAARVSATLASASDASFWINFLDSDGRGVAASNGLSVAGVAYEDRKYFTVHRRDSDAGLYVGAPEVGRVSGRRVFFMSRAVFSPSDDFLGVVVASVDASALARVFSNALFQPTLSITLVHAGGLVIARAPLFEKSFGFDLSNSQVFRHWKARPQGTFEARGLVDGETRVFSYQTVGAAPLAVAVGVAVDPWSRAFSKDMAVALGALAVIVAALTFSGRFALRNFKRLERSEAQLRALNADLRVARDENARGERKARMIADSLPALVGYVDANERYVFHNSFYRTIAGLDLDRIDGSTVEEVLGVEIYARLSEEIRAALRGERMSFERAITVGGLERHFKFEYTPDMDESGRAVGFYTMAIDITEMKNVQSRLSSLARVDALTGMPNRFQLYERLEQSIGRSHPTTSRTACLFLDIDHFKSINDSFGHSAGDQALREFASRLQSCVRDSDLVARLAGDEFVIALEGLSNPAPAESLAKKIIEKMRAPFCIGDMELLVSTSIGVAISNDASESVDDLLNRADQALYSAKKGGRGRFEVNDLGK
jgi:diguanylate cyclase (GGDEF)-like protein/PAS domain S-box-containing protein